MSKEKVSKHEDIEIIDEKIVPSSGTKRIKIKIKERVATRRKKREFSLLFKVLILIMAAILGFKVGEKILSRYISYWKRPHIDYHPAEESKTPQLKAGDVFSAGQ